MMEESGGVNRHGVIRKEKYKIDEEEEGFEEVEDTNFNIIKYLESNEEFDSKEFAGIESVTAEIERDAGTGSQIWSTYEQEVTEYQYDGKEHKAKKLFLKTRVTWTIEREDEDDFEYTQTVYTNVRMPFIEDGMEAANQAKRRARLLVGAYIYSFRAPIDPNHENFKEMQGRLQEVANETWLNVEIPFEGEGLEEYDIAVHMSERLDTKEKRALPMFRLASDVNRVAKRRFSETERSVTQKEMFDLEAERGLIRVGSIEDDVDHVEFYFEEQRFYQRLDGMDREEWLEGLDDLVDNQTKEKYVAHVKREIAQMEVRLGELKHFFEGTPGMVARVGSRLPFMKEHFRSGAVARLENRKKVLKRYEEKIMNSRGVDQETLGKMVVVREQLELEIADEERKILIREKELKDGCEELLALRDKLQFYIKMKLLPERSKDDELTKVELDTVLVPHTIESWKKDVVQSYLDVTRLTRGYYDFAGQIESEYRQSGVVDEKMLQNKREGIRDVDGHLHRIREVKVEGYDEDEEDDEKV